MNNQTIPTTDEIITSLICCNTILTKVLETKWSHDSRHPLRIKLEEIVDEILNCNEGILDEETILNLVDGDEDERNDYIQSLEGSLRNAFISLNKVIGEIFTDL